MKVLLIKKNFTLLSKALGKEHPPMSPKMRSLWKKDAQVSFHMLIHLALDVGEFQLLNSN